MFDRAEKDHDSPDGSAPPFTWAFESVLTVWEADPFGNRTPFSAHDGGWLHQEFRAEKASISERFVASAPFVNFV